ncbi:hypothetical protein F383_29381 [Gossypium arboreum]|uniref:Uncharacterized protein n=1 Tax=Gossypium arboreum TaxID=29729 RepID=A0A0B0PFK1_GOSAR|nr:hypothetical protein F383_29381 [Gossypium arboreum]
MIFKATVTQYPACLEIIFMDCENN